MSCAGIPSWLGLRIAGCCVMLDAAVVEKLGLPWRSTPILLSVNVFPSVGADGPDETPPKKTIPATPLAEIRLERIAFRGDPLSYTPYSKLGTAVVPSGPVPMKLPATTFDAPLAESPAAPS